MHKVSLQVNKKKQGAADQSTHEVSLQVNMKKPDTYWICSPQFKRLTWAILIFSRAPVTWVEKRSQSNADKIGIQKWQRTRLLPLSTDIWTDRKARTHGRHPRCNEKLRWVSERFYSRVRTKSLIKPCRGHSFLQVHEDVHSMPGMGSILMKGKEIKS